MNSNQNTFLEHLQEKKEQWRKIKEDMNDDLIEKRISIIKEKRIFFQNIIISSVTLLGLVSAFVTIKNNPDFIKYYFLAGTGMHVCLICFLIIRIREILDQDLNELKSFQERYDDIANEHINIINKHIKNFNNTTIEKFHKEINSNKIINELKKDEKEIKDEKEKSRKGKAIMDFSGEIVTFLFTGGTILIFLSILGFNLSLKQFLLYSLFLFYITFTDSVGKFTKPFFTFLTFITKRDILPKK